MSWNVEYSEEFERWWATLDEAAQKDVAVSIEILQEIGPSLRRPHVGTLRGSKLTNLRELVTQCKGDPYRTFFVFDPNRTAILLIAGNKRGDKRFYETMIPLAERIYERHLQDLKKREKKS